MSLYSLYQYIRYLARAKHRKGFGVHSPFVFKLIGEVIEERIPYYKYGLIEQVRQLLLKTPKTVYVENDGTGKSGEQKIATIVKKSSLSKTYAQVLFRLVNFYKAQDILELGSSFGLTTMYLAAPDSRSKVVAIEGCADIAAYAKLSCQRAGFENITIENGHIDRCLPEVLAGFEKLDFVFFNANHRQEAFLSYFEQCLKKSHAKTVFVINDIYYSKEMTQAWEKIKQREEIRVTIDMFVYGIVLFDPDLQKEDYTLFFMPDTGIRFKE